MDATTRKKKVNDEVVRIMAQEGKSAQRIAQELGISTASVYHSEGWKNRKN